MDDSSIIEMYWNRNEQAIHETHKKYGKYCYSIAYKILKSREDADESVNDTYMGAWKSIPPSRPQFLSTFLGKITRNIALKKFRNNTAQKRGGNNQNIYLSELEECLPSNTNIDEQIEVKELAQLINEFLRTLDEDECSVFICRYWYFDSITDICMQFGYGKSKVKMMLMRTRNKLKTELEKEGISL